LAARSRASRGESQWHDPSLPKLPAFPDISQGATQVIRQFVASWTLSKDPLPVNGTAAQQHDQDSPEEPGNPLEHAKFIDMNARWVIVFQEPKRRWRIA
jgi:hypothetical protein